MITADFTGCANLTDFYKSIRECHENAHGIEYTAHHNELSRLFQTQEITSYRELGIMQGATAACAAISGASKLHLIDIDISKFKPYQHLFNDIDITVSCQSSLSFQPEELQNVDVLLIDTVHNPKQVFGELNIFAASTNKYIILHDTYAISSIQKMIERDWLPNSSWELEYYHKKNVGYTLLKRKK